LVTDFSVRRSLKIVHSESVIVRSESVELIFIVYEECAANHFSNRGRRAPAAAMLKQEELAFIKAVSTLQVTPALLRELRTALTTRKRRTVVPAGFRGRAPGGGPRTSQRPPGRLAGKRKANELANSGESMEPPIRRPAPDAGSTPIHAKPPTGEQAVNSSRQLGSPEGGSTYAAVFAGSAAPIQPSGTLKPTAMDSNPSESAVSTETATRRMS
jgi:hypothetical protein